MKKIFLLVLAFCPCFATSFSFGESIEVSNQKELLELILQNKEYCSQDIEEGKIYLKPEMVFLAKEGTFLRIDQFSLVQLPSISSDEKGLFFSMF